LSRFERFIVAVIVAVIVVLVLTWVASATLT
jgi:hypothetical protein